MGERVRGRIELPVRPQGRNIAEIVAPRFILPSHGSPRDSGRHAQSRVRAVTPLALFSQISDPFNHSRKHQKANAAHCCALVAFSLGMGVAAGIGSSGVVSILLKQHFIRKRDKIPTGRYSTTRNYPAAMKP